MSNLLIHSMAEFSAIIMDCLRIAGARQLVEIGAEYGGMSQRLAGYAAEVGGSLVSIDPSPQPEFVRWAAHAPVVRHIAAPSLVALPELADVDAWIIDGDHNYYTVFHELQEADAIGRRDGKPLLAFLHDVGWPSGRRDQYCAPDRIPDAFRLPHSFDSGATLDHPELVPGRGFRGCGNFAMAHRLGGPRNGVLTAVEDFGERVRAQGRSLAWAHVPAVFGLGVLFDASAPWAAAIAEVVAPFHDNALLASLEENRLRNYLAVIEWQDRTAAAA